MFTQRGLDATLDDVARQAGVGVGTVYRRFPDKESLVAELFADRIDAMVAVAEQALAAPDPWQALVSYLEYATETMASSIGLRQLMMVATYGRDRVAYAREQMRPVVTKLVERAQEAGVLREDFRATDVPLIAYMLAAAAEYARLNREHFAGSIPPMPVIIGLTAYGKCIGLTRGGGSLKILNPTEHVREVLEVTHVDSCLPCYTDEAKALASFRGSVARA